MNATSRVKWAAQRWERLAVLGLSLAVLALSQLPVVWAWRAEALRSHPDKVFTGAMPTYADDAATYWSWMDQAREGRFFFADRFTPDDHPRDYVNVLFWALGNVSRATGLGVVTVYSLARPAIGALLLLLLYLLSMRLFSTPGSRLACFCFLVLGSGWEGVLEYVGPPLRLAHVPSPEWWTPEMNTFFSLLLFPHFLAGFCCMIGTLLLMMAAWAEDERTTSSRVRFAAAAGVVMFCLTFFHPYDVVSVVGVLCGAPILFAWIRPGTLRRDLGLSAVALGLWLPALVYNYWLFRSNPAMLAWDLQNQMWTPEPVRLLVGLGIAFPLAVIASSALRSMGRPLLVMWLWLVAILVAIHLPVRFQRRMIGGIQFPLAALTVAFLVLILVPWLARRWPRLRDRVPLPTTVGAGLLLTAAVLAPVYCVTPFYLLRNEWRGLRAATYPSWLDADLVDAFRFVAHLGPPEAIVVSSYETGNFLPHYTGRRSVLGHYALTIDSNERGKEIARFFSAGPEADPWRIESLRRWNARYVVHGPHERALGDFDPASRAWLRRLHVSGEGSPTATAVYAVELELSREAP